MKRLLHHIFLVLLILCLFPMCPSENSLYFTIENARPDYIKDCSTRVSEVSASCITIESGKSQAYSDRLINSEPKPSSVIADLKILDESDNVLIQETDDSAIDNTFTLISNSSGDAVYRLVINP